MLDGSSLRGTRISIISERTHLDEILEHFALSFQNVALLSIFSVTAAKFKPDHNSLPTPVFPVTPPLSPPSSSTPSPSFAVFIIYPKYYIKFSLPLLLHEVMNSKTRGHTYVLKCLSCQKSAGLCSSHSRKASQLFAPTSA